MNCQTSDTYGNACCRLQSPTPTINIATDSLANELNIFYSRFEVTYNSNINQQDRECERCLARETKRLTVTEQEVRRLREMNARKACGQDNIQRCAK